MEFFKNFFRRKTQEEIDLQDELGRVEEQLKRDQELLSNKKPLSGNKKLAMGLAGVIAAGGAGYGIKKATDYMSKPDSDSQKEKMIEKVDAPKKSKEVYMPMADAPWEIHITPSKPGAEPIILKEKRVDLSKMVEQSESELTSTQKEDLKDEMPNYGTTKAEEVKAKTEKMTETLPPSPDIKLGKNIKEEKKPAKKIEKKPAPKVVKKAAPAPIPSPVTEQTFPPANELEAAELRAKIAAQIDQKPAQEWNRTVTMGQTINIGGAPETPKQTADSGFGGKNIVYGYGSGFWNPAMKSGVQTPDQNTLNLSGESLAKVNKVFNENFGKLFPHKSESALRKILNKGVYDFMDKTGEKIQKGRRVSAEDKNLYEYLVKLERITGVTPGDMTSREPQTVGGYIAKALQKAEKDGKLP